MNPVCYFNDLWKLISGRIVKVEHGFHDLGSNVWLKGGLYPVPVSEANDLNQLLVGNTTRHDARGL